MKLKLIPLVMVMCLVISFATALKVNIPVPTNFSNIVINETANDTQFLRGLTPQQVANLYTETDPKAYNGTLAYNSSLANYYLNTNPFSFYNSTSIPAYALIINLVSYVGNWSLDKPNYYNKTQVDSNITSLNNASIARAGTYNCTSGQVLQNITTNSSGVFGKCVTASSGGVANNTVLTNTRIIIGNTTGVRDSNLGYSTGGGLTNITFYTTGKNLTMSYRGVSDGYSDNILVLGSALKLGASNWFYPGDYSNAMYGDAIDGFYFSTSYAFFFSSTIFASDFLTWSDTFDEVKANRTAMQEILSEQDIINEKGEVIHLNYSTEIANVKLSPKFNANGSYILDSKNKPIMENKTAISIVAQADMLKKAIIEKDTQIKSLDLQLNNLKTCIKDSKDFTSMKLCI